jgi:hypothetical protein
VPAGNSFAEEDDTPALVIVRSVRETKRPSVKPVISFGVNQGMSPSQ